MDFKAEKTNFYLIQYSMEQLEQRIDFVKVAFLVTGLVDFRIRFLAFANKLIVIASFFV